jgi:hypothetical protein
MSRRVSVAEIREAVSSFVGLSFSGIRGKVEYRGPIKEVWVIDTHVLVIILASCVRLCGDARDPDQAHLRWEVDLRSSPRVHEGNLMLTYKHEVYVLHDSEKCLLSTGSLNGGRVPWDLALRHAHSKHGVKI